MSVMKLKKETTEIGFSPLFDYMKSRIYDIRRHRSVSGKLYSYKFFTDKQRHEIPVIFTVAVEAKQINDWCKDNVELTFYPDLINNPSVSKVVHIVNTEDPLNMMKPTWDNNYQGTIILEEM